MAQNVDFDDDDDDTLSTRYQFSQHSLRLVDAVLSFFRVLKPHMFFFDFDTLSHDAFPGIVQVYCLHDFESKFIQSDYSFWLQP
jgi:hypothetical protein